MQPSKAELREGIWKAMTEAKAALFPGAYGRIPNFVGAAQAASHVFQLDAWKRAKVLKCNPDMPQLPVRRRALEEGKIVYMAVPRLTSRNCFVELDPRLIQRPGRAATIKGAFHAGRAVHPRSMRPIDLIMCGSVAVAADGSRLGKGGGFSDLEYAIARGFGLVEEDTPIVTTVHSLQVTQGPVPMTRHDITVDFIGTPEGLLRCDPRHPRPTGIYWDEVGEKLEEVPILQELVAALQSHKG
jgi:5-formyltetrahydrofolate cyclo-ligase